MGGFHAGLAPLGGRCVLACDVDWTARAFYRASYGGPECLSDVVALDPENIPQHDILTAGFPCQPFAFCNMKSGSLQAGPGVDEASGRGALAFEVARLLRASRPAAFILENVPNLCSFNGGNDLRLFLEALRADSAQPEGQGYVVEHAFLEARDFGLCQQRRRLYIVGFRAPDLQGAARRFQWPAAATAGCAPEGSAQPPPTTPTTPTTLTAAATVTTATATAVTTAAATATTTTASRSGATATRGLLGASEPQVRLRDILQPDEEVPADCWLSEERWQRILERTEGDAARPSGRGGRIARLDGYARTVTSSYRSTDRYAEFVPPRRSGGDSEAEVLAQASSSEALEDCGDEGEDQDQDEEVGGQEEEVFYKKSGATYKKAPAVPLRSPPRFFSPIECARLQGFSDSFAKTYELKCKDPHRFYHLVGNAVCPPVVQALGEAVLAALGPDLQLARASRAAGTEWRE
ncbi:unnamed protein product [Polarella glacialis]|uniref:DNA (cytosine-5-)-methyltransferase n=1 Tax=Polarella glacialis TaxID=89957 RepID=A0A813H0Z2_POLGL|nr:unnamed protein product [Polarella glacialis]